MREAENLRTLYGTADEINVKEAGATAFYAMGEGGFLSALWKMAEASQVGLEMDFSKVPIRQETIEICEIFDIYLIRYPVKGSQILCLPQKTFRKMLS